MFQVNENQPPKFFQRISRNSKIDLWKNWGGHVHPSPPRGDATGYNYVCLKICLRSVLKASLLSP